MRAPASRPREARPRAPRRRAGHRGQWPRHAGYASWNHIRSGEPAVYRGPPADDHEAAAGFPRMSGLRVALVLPGGGARSAYQVGVLKAIAGWYPPGSPLPFQVLCGTSAGAINAAVLASLGGDFG